MTSTTSSTKALHGLKETYFWALQRQKTTAGLLVLLLLAVNPVILLVGMNAEHTAALQDLSVDLHETFLGMESLFITFTVTPVCLLFTLLLSISMFQYMSSKRSVDLFHALPVRREAHLLGRFLAGETILVASLAIMLFAVLLIGSVYQVLSVEILLLLAKYFLWIAFMLTACFLFCILMVVLSGSIMDTFVSIAGISIGYPILILCAISFASTALPGYAMQNGFSKELITAFVPEFAIFIPLLYLSGTIQSTESFSFTGFFLWWLFLSILMAGSAFYFYKKRKSEAAENTTSFPIPKHIIRFILTAAAGLGLGLVIFSIQSSIPNFFIGLFIGSIITHLVTEVAYYHNLGSLKKNLKTYGVFLAAFAVFFISIIFGGFGFTQNVPTESDVVSVKWISDVNNDLEVGYPDAQNSNTFRYQLVNPEITSKDVIHKTLAYHQELADYYGTNRLASFETLRGYTQRVTFEYKLKNGKTLYRSFIQPLENKDVSNGANYLFEDEKVALFDSEAFVKATSILFYVEPKHIHYINLDNPAINTQETEKEYRPSKEQAQKLLEAVRKDTLAHQTWGIRNAQRYGDSKIKFYLTINYIDSITLEPNTPLAELVGPKTKVTSLLPSNVPIYADSTNTLALLKEWNWIS